LKRSSGPVIEPAHIAAALLTGDDATMRESAHTSKRASELAARRIRRPASSAAAGAGQSARDPDLRASLKARSNAPSSICKRRWFKVASDADEPSHSRISPPAASFASRQVRPPAPNLDTDGARCSYQPARPTRQLTYFDSHHPNWRAHRRGSGKDPHHKACDLKRRFSRVYSPKVLPVGAHIHEAGARRRRSFGCAGRASVAERH
jgi:hypothetical protein